MSDEKKKPSLALVIAEKDKSDDDAPDSAREESDEKYEAARDELADVLGVKDADREAFGNALRAFVVTCK